MAKKGGMTFPILVLLLGTDASVRVITRDVSAEAQRRSGRSGGPCCSSSTAPLTAPADLLEEVLAVIDDVLWAVAPGPG